MKASRVCCFCAILGCGWAVADTRYVDIHSASPASPYTSWATAANNIQSAVDAAAPGDTVLVADGVYNAGKKATPGYACMNRVVITKAITVQSLNGPASTFIVGEGPMGNNAVRGVYMSAGTLSGFTVTNGYTRTTGDFTYDRSGGGVNMWGGSGVITNCTLAGNSTSYDGGGSSGGTLFNCALSNNSVQGNGGASTWGTLYNCTLTGNTAEGGGGGSYHDTLYNCIVYHNATLNSYYDSDDAGW